MPLPLVANLIHVCTIPYQNSYLPTSRPKPLTSARNRFLQSQRPQQQILYRQQRKENRVAQIGRTRHDRRHHSVHPVMVRRRHDRHQNHPRISQTHGTIEHFPPQTLFALALLHCRPEYSRVVDHRATDDECVAEVHGRHGGEGVDEVATHPDGGGIVVADGIKEAVFGGK